MVTRVPSPGRDSIAKSFTNRFNFRLFHQIEAHFHGSCADPLSHPDDASIARH